MDFFERPILNSRYAYRAEDVCDKANTIKNYWIAGVNKLGRFGRCAFAEFTEVFEIEAEFDGLIDVSTAEAQA